MAFEIISQEKETDGIKYIAYGIAYTDENSFLKTIPDISADFSAVSSLVTELNACAPEKSHIIDIIDDFLFDPI